MLVCPPGWSSDVLHGNLVLRSPRLMSGESAAEVRYREGVRPLFTAAALVSEVLFDQPDFQRQKQSPPELFITAEGEYAALVRVSGRLGRYPVWHLISAVYGDDRMNVLDALVSDPAALAEVAQLVRRLIYADQLNLGVRKRRFLYQPPVGWQPLASGLLCTWYPPDYPRQLATLVAHPAMPRDSSEDAVLATFIKAYQRRGFVVEAVTDGEPVTSDFGLHGKAFCLMGRFPDKPALTFDVLVLADARYLYSLILESGAAARRSALHGVLPTVARSVRPIPEPTAARVSAAPTAPNSWSF